MIYHPGSEIGSDTNQYSSSVDKIMSKRFVWVHSKAGIDVAIDTILRSNQSGAPVLNKDMNAIGFLSQKDCLRLVNRPIHRSGFQGTVSDYMTNTVNTISACTKVSDVIQIFIEKWFHAYPVVNDKKKVIGLLTRKSVLEHINSLSPSSWYHSGASQIT